MRTGSVGGVKCPTDVDGGEQGEDVRLQEGHQELEAGEGDEHSERERRSGDEQTRLHICVDLADLELSAADPAGLAVSGFHRRHPQARPHRTHFPRVYPAADAARLVLDWTAGATVVGVVPEFDLECLSAMLGRQGLSPQWADTVDVVPLAERAVRLLGLDPERHHEDLSRQCGVKPPGLGDRHTALGDARWAKRWYDALRGRSGSPE